MGAVTTQLPASGRRMTKMRVPCAPEHQDRPYSRKGVGPTFGKFPTRGIFLGLARPPRRLANSANSVIPSEGQ
jgi:hypothetical protein